MELARAYIRAGVTQANITGTKLITLHNKKVSCNKNIIFVSKITLNKYAKDITCLEKKENKEKKKY